MDKNNSGETKKKKQHCCSVVNTLPFYTPLFPCSHQQQKFQQAASELLSNKNNSKEVVSKNAGKHSFGKKKKKTAQQEVAGARWQEVVRSSQFKSADGTATPNQLQTVRVRPAPTTAADGESHIALLYLTSKGCPSEMASL